MFKVNHKYPKSSPVLSQVVPKRRSTAELSDLLPVIGLSGQQDQHPHIIFLRQPHTALWNISLDNIHSFHSLEPGESILRGIRFHWRDAGRGQSKAQMKFQSVPFTAAVLCSHPGKTTCRRPCSCSPERLSTGSKSDRSTGLSVLSNLATLL